MVPNVLCRKAVPTLRMCSPVVSLEMLTEVCRHLPGRRTASVAGPLSFWLLVWGLVLLSGILILSQGGGGIKTWSDSWGIPWDATSQIPPLTATLPHLFSDRTGPQCVTQDLTASSHPVLTASSSPCHKPISWQPTVPPNLVLVSLLGLGLDPVAPTSACLL